MKLKTLYDFSYLRDKGVMLREFTEDFDDTGIWIHTKTLRDEAIKWIKELENETANKMAGKSTIKKVVYLEKYQGAVEFIERFFNITEKDLK